jgi:LemA protein
MVAVIVVVALLVIVIAMVVPPFNGLVRRRNRVDASWSQIDVQLRRRYDLIPNLVETVKGYAAHESGVFKDVADARSRLLAAKSPEETIQAANQQTSALGRLLAIAENYPQLKANEQFNRLMDELAGTENRLAVERMRYNDGVRAYNTHRRKFPSNVTAKVFGFKEYPYWEVPPEARTVPKVDFSK